jgi:hypothetical protein
MIKSNPGLSQWSVLLLDRRTTRKGKHLASDDRIFDNHLTCRKYLESVRRSSSKPIFVAA